MQRATHSAEVEDGVNDGGAVAKAAENVAATDEEPSAPPAGSERQGKENPGLAKSEEEVAPITSHGAFRPKRGDDKATTKRAKSAARPEDDPRTAAATKVQGARATSTSQAKPVNEKETDEGDEENVEDKRMRRMLSNRESARRSRERKQACLAVLSCQHARLWNQVVHMRQNMVNMSQLVCRIHDENCRLTVEWAAMGRQALAINEGGEGGYHAGAAWANDEDSRHAQQQYMEPQQQQQQQQQYHQQILPQNQRLQHHPQHHQVMSPTPCYAQRPATVPGQGHGVENGKGVVDDDPKETGQRSAVALSA